MGLPNAALIIVAIVVLYWLVPYYLTGAFGRNRFHKFIPALLCLLSMAVLYVKLAFISQGFEGIADIVFMILFAVAFVGLFVLALVWGGGKTNSDASQ